MHSAPAWTFILIKVAQQRPVLSNAISGETPTHCGQ